MKQLTLAMILIAALLFAATGCRLLNPPAEPVTFSMLYNQHASSPLREDWLILQEYQKRQGVTLDIRPGDDANFDTELVNVLESGVVPDILLKVWPDPVASYAAEGLLLPVSDYMQQMPHFRAYVAAHDLEDELDKLRMDDAKFYVLPGYQRQIQVQQWIYRRDLFEKHDLGVPATYDELFEAIAYLQSLYPDVAGITACWGGAHLLAMMGAGYDIPAGWAGTRDYHPATDRWRYAPVTDEYRELYRFLNRCYEAGVLDPATMSQSAETYIERLQAGEAMVTVSWITSGFSNWNAALSDHGIPDGQWAPLPVPASTMGIRALPPVDPYRKGLAVSSTVVDKPYFERLIQFLDWAVYSEEGMTLTTWGVEGVTYEETEAGKAFLPHIKTNKNPEGDVDMTAAYGLATLFNLNENAAFEDSKKPPEIVQFLNASLARGDTAPLDPAIKLSDADIGAISLIEETLSPYVAQASAQFITGELDMDADWDAYVAELEKRGCRAIEDIWNGAWIAQKN